jgi:hypothetical protein
MSLVWLGHSLTELRHIRSNSIGAERGSAYADTAGVLRSIKKAMGPIGDLPQREQGMVHRYAGDVHSVMTEISRVLRPEGHAIMVVGNSCLKDIFIKNASGVAKAASLAGLKLVKRAERELPDNRRYLPMPAKRTASLGMRMRTETILTFKHQ